MILTLWHPNPIATFWKLNIFYWSFEKSKEMKGLNRITFQRQVCHVLYFLCIFLYIYYETFLVKLSCHHYLHLCTVFTFKWEYLFQFLQFLFAFCYSFHHFSFRVQSSCMVFHFIQIVPSLVRHILFEIFFTTFILQTWF